MEEPIIISLAKLSDQLQKDNKLELLVSQFREKYSLSPCFGVELEFYASDNFDIADLSRLAQVPIKQERGGSQYEIDLPPSIDLTLYATQINQVREKLKQTAVQLKGEIDFTSKPKAHDYGSSMHFHLNFVNYIQDDPPVIAREQTVFALSLCHPGPRAGIPKNQKSWIPDQVRDDNWLLDFAASSLCHYMLDTFCAFMPGQEDYVRIDHNFMAPINVSYGNNNRTTAIRIPDALPKRLEHRVSSATADPYLVMVTMLQSVLCGLENQNMIKMAPKIYGNAFDGQYDLVRFPRSLHEAALLFKEEFYYL